MQCMTKIKNQSTQVSNVPDLAEKSSFGLVEKVKIAFFSQSSQSPE